MVKSHADARLVLSPGLTEAPVLDRLCSQFVLTLTMKNAGRFNLRRDWNSLLSLTGRHLVWPATVLARLRGFLDAALQGQRAVARPRSAGRRRLHGAPRRVEGAVRGRHAVLLHRRIHQGRAEGPARRAGCDLRLAREAAEEGTHARRKEHRCAGRPLAAQPSRARAAALRHARALPARLARTARRVQGGERAGGVRGDRDGGRRQRARRGRSAARGLAARAHRHGREPDLRAQHHRSGRPDEGQRAVAAGADARIPGAERPDGGVHTASEQERADGGRLLVRRRRRAGA